MKFIVYAPPYRHNSAGVRVLHELNRLLNKCGYNSEIYNNQEITDKDIVIYPETVEYNPLNAKNVVRYVLQTPGFFGQEQKTYPENEYIVTYHPIFYDNVPSLYIDVIEPSLFYTDHGIKKDTISIYVGKGIFHPMIENPRVPEGFKLQLITHNNPATREDLAMLLKMTKTLYTYDNCTALKEEAVMCGCKVFFVSEEGMQEFISNYKSSYGEKKHIKQFARNAVEFFKTETEFYDSRWANGKEWEEAVR